MRILIIFFLTLFLFCSSGLSQPENLDSSALNRSIRKRTLIHVRDKIFIDSSWSSMYRPDSIFVYYYNVRSKYPESSETLREKASGFVMETGQKFTGSGYITFRFCIDSLGQMQKRVEVLETDEFYKKYYFDDNLVWTLFDFLKCLHKWKPARAPQGYPPFYINVVSFKIHEGNIVNIIP